eukprot:gene24902-31296_t
MLSTYTGPVSTIETQWNIKRLMVTIVDLSPSVTNPSDRDRLLNIANEMEKDVQRLQSDFSEQILHGDLAYYNVIATRMENGRPQVSGVIDFGDATRSWLIGELAVAITPLMVHTHKPCYLLACDVLRGYLRKASLNRSEVLALWPLVVQRSLVNFVSISHQLLQDPGNQYCADELVLNKALMDNCTQIPAYLAQEALLLAAGMSPSTQMEGVSSLLISPALTTTSVLSGVTLKDFSVLDLGVASEEYTDGDWLQQTASVLPCCGKVPSVVPYGVPQLNRTEIRSHAPPSTVPLFTTINTATGTKLLAPFDCTVRCVPLTVASRSSVSHAAASPVCGVVLQSTVHENLSVLFQGVGVIGEEGHVYTAGTQFAQVTHTAFTAQILPFGLTTSTATQYTNNSQQYSVDFLPPAYCSEQDWNEWSLLCPDPTPLLFGALPQGGANNEVVTSVITNTNKSHIASTDRTAQDTRYAYFASVQEHYFRRPPVMERGHQQFLYDRFGRAYLDMVNNVAVVGHSHSAVIDATVKQLRLLNTNSRFIYDLLGKFTQRIVSTIPSEITKQGGLNVVFLVNSGSEATDLALRISRSVVTARRRKLIESKNSNIESGAAADFKLNRDVICLEGAYHGVTTASDEVSTTLNDNPNSLSTRAPWIHLVRMPNLYRGAYQAESYGKLLDENTSEDVRVRQREEVATASEKYVDLVRDKVSSLVALGTPPSAFIAEPLSGNAGGVELPPGYLQGVYRAVREAGGLCISDEVQVGYGRLGASFWGFQEHGVVPDVVTMAKAAGNGHPLGYVITSRQIASEFGAAEGSFFSSAGGGPVSCAVGLAVLETLQKEALQENAREVGAYTSIKLKELAARHPHVIGCIHGHGLYQGVELVRATSDGAKTPATAEAYAICERLLELGVICHNTGDYSNVLKVKPPLCFSKADADFFVSALEITIGGGW